MFYSVLGLNQESLQRLQTHLGRLVKPQEVDLVSPLVDLSLANGNPTVCRGHVADEVWDACKLDSLPSWLREAECRQRAKHGSYSLRRGYYSDANMRTGIEAFFRCPERLDDCPAARRHANRYLRQRGLLKGVSRLELIDLTQASQAFIGRSSFGLPVMSSNPKYFGEVFNLSEQVLRDGRPEQILSYPAVLNTRGQPIGPFQKPKTRVVFGCSRVIGNIEKMVFVPVFNRLVTARGFAAWQGQRSVDAAISRIMSATATQPILSVDFQNFDATVPNTVIDSVFDLFRDWFTPTAHPLISMLQMHFKECALVAPDQIYVGKVRGIPSGSVLTNLVGSLANMWVMAYASYMLGTTVRDCEVQGDDGVYLFGRDVAPEQLAAVLKDHFGMTMSVEKSYDAFWEVHYLQNVHRHTYVDNMMYPVGIRPIMRVLNGMMSYESFKPGWSGAMDTLRWLQQMETASAHPCFDAFVEWFIQRDKYSTLSIETLIQKAGGVENVNATLGGGAWSNKTPITAMSRSRVVKTINRLLGH